MLLIFAYELLVAKLFSPTEELYDQTITRRAKNYTAEPQPRKARLHELSVFSGQASLSFELTKQLSERIRGFSPERIKALLKFIKPQVLLTKKNELYVVTHQLFICIAQLLIPHETITFRATITAKPEHWTLQEASLAAQQYLTPIVTSNVLLVTEIAEGLEERKALTGKSKATVYRNLDKAAKQ